MVTPRRTQTSLPIAGTGKAMRSAQAGILCLTDSNAFCLRLYLEAGEFNLWRQLCYYCIHIKMVLNSTLHYSREAILGFTPSELHVGQRVLTLSCTSSAGSMSILATITQSERVISRLLPAYAVSLFPQKCFAIHGLKALQVLSINASVENVQPVSRDRMCLYC